MGAGRRSTRVRDQSPHGCNTCAVIIWGVAWGVSCVIAHVHTTPQLGLVTQKASAGVSAPPTGELVFWVAHEPAFLLEAVSDYHPLEK
jgi:hypothetical protein